MPSPGFRSLWGGGYLAWLCCLESVCFRPSFQFFCCQPKFYKLNNLPLPWPLALTAEHPDFVMRACECLAPVRIRALPYSGVPHSWYRASAAVCGRQSQLGCVLIYLLYARAGAGNRPVPSALLVLVQTDWVCGGDSQLSY